MKPTYFRTPRTLNDAFGPYSKLHVERKKESGWWYVVASAVVVAIVFIACYRG